MKALLLGASLLLAFPAAAAAQSAPGATSVPPPPSASVGRLVIPGNLSTGYEPREMARLRRDGGGTSSQRRERAERLVALVNSGQCQAAHDIAVREGDRIMAERIGDVCRPSADPTPAA
jgi:hypothetical protein